MFPVPTNGGREVSVAHGAFEIADVTDFEFHHLGRRLGLSTDLIVRLFGKLVVETSSQATEISTFELIQTDLTPWWQGVAMHECTKSAGLGAVPHVVDRVFGVSPEDVLPVVTTDRRITVLLEVDTSKRRMAKDALVFRLPEIVVIR